MKLAFLIFLPILLAGCQAPGTGRVPPVFGDLTQIRDAQKRLLGVEMRVEEAYAGGTISQETRDAVRVTEERAGRLLEGLAKEARGGQAMTDRGRITLQEVGNILTDIETNTLGPAGGRR